MWHEKLRAIKKRSGLSTREIAEKSKIPEPTLEKIFAGATKEPKLTTIIQLVHSLGGTLCDLDDQATSITGGLSANEELLILSFRRCSTELRFAALMLMQAASNTRLSQGIEGEAIASD